MTDPADAQVDALLDELHTRIRDKLQELTGSGDPEGDHRAVMLLIYGCYTDMRRSPCERCGVPIVRIDNRNQRPVWAEVNRDGGNFVDSTFIVHTADRCHRPSPGHTVGHDSRG